VAPSWRLRRRQAEDGRVDVTGCVGPCYPCFVVFFLLGPRGVVVIYLFLGPIYRTLEGWCSLPLPILFHSLKSRSEPCSRFQFQLNEGGRAVTSVVYELCWILIKKICSCTSCVQFGFPLLICLSSVPYLGARVLQPPPANFFHDFPPTSSLVQAPIAVHC
jgi:hypothetical protein